MLLAHGVGVWQCQPCQTLDDLRPNVGRLSLDALGLPGGKEGAHDIVRTPLRIGAVVDDPVSVLAEPKGHSGADELGAEFHVRAGFAPGAEDEPINLP